MKLKCDAVQVKYQKVLLISILVIGDLLMVSLASWLAWYIQFSRGTLISGTSTDLGPFTLNVLLPTIVFVSIFALSGLYDRDHLFGGAKEYGLVFQGCNYGMVALLLTSYLSQSQPLSTDWLLSCWALSIISVGVARFLMRRLFFRLRRSKGWFIQKTLLVGVSDHAIMIARQIQEQATGVEIIGFLDEFLPVGATILENIKVLGTPDQIHEIAASQQVEQVILFSNAVAWETFRDTMYQSGYKHGFRLNLSPGFYEILTSGFKVTHQALVPLISVKPARIQGGDWILKTALDYSLGTLLFLISLPLDILIIFMIHFSDGGPLFTLQQVLGLNGEIFWLRKFRTNFAGEARRRLDDPELKKDIRKRGSDSWVGHFLFRSGLDKLPQLWAVLRGKLSLVGPRVIVTDHEYMKSQGFHPSLLTVKPGWTGPWAVWGADTIADEKRLNLHYIRNWTIWADLQILFQTFRLALSRQTHLGK
ncbi:MAG: sugar transferase [Anaerolineales bacterium]|nr:sugar transferase [Anaerolineales bacterium]